ncbi:MAG: glycosyltransferase family 4 protein, partial [Euryarchaeota archaeon]
MQSTACDTDSHDEWSRRPRVGIMTHVDVERAGALPLDNLVALVSPIASKLFLITGGDYHNEAHEMEIIRVKARRSSSLVSKILEQASVQIRISRILLNLRSEIDILLFFNGAGLTLPLIFARFLRIKCIIILMNLGAAPVIHATKESGAQGQFGELIRLHIQGILERLSYFFADELIVYAPSIVEEAGLRKYKQKVVIAREHFLHFDQYRLKDDIERRDNIIGYIGRLKHEKGIMNLVKAIPEILRQKNDATFLIIGEGHLEDEIRTYLGGHGLHDKVTLVGWVPHEELPDYLTRLKLLVLPSYTEGLPNTMLEAMACGTPVLATSVGAIPDVLRDKETGFLIRDNSPQCLAKKIEEALTDPELKRIALNARNFVENRFQYETVVETWRDIICATEANDSV